MCENAQYLTTSLVAATISNMTSSLAGHPLDTIRIRMQMDPDSKCFFSCCRDLISKEGTKSFFKGVSTPMVGSVIGSNVHLVGNKVTKDALDNSGLDLSENTKVALAGATAGFMGLSVFVPVELLKCRAQMTFNGSMSYMEEIKSLYKCNGMYKGFWAMFWRDVPGFAAHFLIYEQIKSLNPFPQDCSYSEMYNLLWAMNAGGIAGMIRWTMGIPQDYVKTKQMTTRTSHVPARTILQ